MKKVFGAVLVIVAMALVFFAMIYFGRIVGLLIMAAGVILIRIGERKDV